MDPRIHQVTLPGRRDGSPNPPATARQPTPDGRPNRPAPMPDARRINLVDQPRPCGRSTPPPDSTKPDGGSTPSPRTRPTRTADRPIRGNPLSPNPATPSTRPDPGQRRSTRPAYRNARNAALTSSTNTPGCSNAAK